LCFLTFAVTSPARAQGLDKKIGTLDLSKVFDGYEKTKSFDAALEKDYNAYQADLDKKIKDLQEAQGKLAILKDDEKKKEQDQIDQMTKDIQTFRQTKEADLSKQRDEKIREILLEIEKTVSDFAKKEKYDLILNNRVLIYGADSFDVSDQILTILNENYNKSK
jgi:outer membrane protein